MSDDIEFDDLEAVESLLSLCEENQTDSTDRFTARTLSEVAQFFGVATQTVKQWRTETPPMPGTEGAWKMPEIVRWRHAKITQSDAVQAQRNEQLESVRLKNEQMRNAIAARRGELIERDEVERDISLAMSHLRNRLGNLSRSIAMFVPSDCKTQVMQDVEETVRLAFKELSESLRSIKENDHEQTE